MRVLVATKEYITDQFSIKKTSDGTGGLLLSIMCDSGLVIIAILTMFFSLIAIQSIFYSFDYNCNNFYYDDVVGPLASVSFYPFRTDNWCWLVD